MYRIAICDDEKSVCSELENYIEKYLNSSYIDGSVEVFYSGEALCDYINQQERLDLIFLDIKLPNRTGVDVGRYLREELKDERTDIIYISSKTEYALELFKCRPLDFIIKPVRYADVENILDVVVKRNQVRHQSFSLRSDNANYILPLMDILYFRSENKKVHIVLVSGEEQAFSGKLDEVEKSLPESCFLRIHKSFLINYDYVSQYTLEWVRMTNGDVMNISKTYRTDVKRKLLHRETE